MPRFTKAVAMTSTLADVYVVPTGKVADVYGIAITYTGTPVTASVTVNAVVDSTARPYVPAMAVAKNALYNISPKLPLLAGEKVEASCTETGGTILIAVNERDAS